MNDYDRPPNRIEVVKNPDGALENIMYRDTLCFTPNEWEAYKTSRREKKRNGLNKDNVIMLKNGVKSIDLMIDGKYCRFIRMDDELGESDNKIHIYYKRLPRKLPGK